MTADGRWLSPDPSPTGHGQFPQMQVEGLQWDCSSIFSWEGAVGTSASLVVMDQLMPWAANRDPLGQAQQFLLWLWLWSHRAGSASLGELNSTQLEGTVAAETSSSIKETSSSIACWSSTTLSTRWHGSLGISGWALSTQYWSALA